MMYPEPVLRNAMEMTGFSDAGSICKLKENTICRSVH
jgi:hypothetical protein